MMEETDIPYEVHSKVQPGGAGSGGLNNKMDEYEKKLILEALNETKGNKARASELLKINRVTLLAKIKKYGI
jgi:DNA-binding NtrC family response regulator